ncbi:MAG: hypothetical protein OXI26_06960 [bacterium]|nr:hypothetical protein [bacterium]
MGDSPRSRRRPRFILLASCAAVALLLTACFDEGHPTSFDDTVEENFLTGCEVAAEADPQISPVAPRYCVCAYERVRAEIAFEDFKSLDDDVRDDPNKVGNDDEESTAAQLTAIFADCRATHARG